MDSLDFSEEEIQEQLAILGYKNIPKHRLREFKQDLDGLIRHGEWKTFASSNQINSTENHPALSQPSPPAYTKEKVSQCNFKDSGQGFFLHADHERQVLTTCQNRDYGRQQRHCDSYAQHSLAPNLQPPPGAPTRLQVELDPEDTLHPPFTDSYTSSPDTQGRRFIKRKVLRKHKGQTLVCDESIYSEDSDAASCLEDRLAELHLSTSPCHGSETENEDVTSQSDSRSSEPDGISLTAFESYIRGMTRSQSDGDLRPKPKSFIRPVMSQQTIKKTDPVAKYFQYKQLWEMFKLPGEKDRRALRLEMKERLAYQPPPPKPRRVYVPNTYIVPTEKKRSALRWEIRNDLANGLLPHKFTYRF
ncbi:centriolar and ciliogenesis-associated protein HYLS1 isoform X2 [Seriola aureovittata]|uniref:centriolar and ciliogenesis-associated protein HYLS1 isoform X2 n=1 Tax=Seriola aureovittata TaxID=2871759 RepID=UPI0024BD8A60|nr:centriolar and ciliogenesis-associated protein HYLS1 isoform X2 [Seriola aureovittata]